MLVEHIKKMEERSKKMDDENGKKIVDRLQAEGQLTRNTGTNSIKALNNRVDRFTMVLESVNAAVLDQTAILQETLNLEKARIIDEERARQLARVDTK